MNATGSQLEQALSYKTWCNLVAGRWAPSYAPSMDRPENRERLLGLLGRFSNTTAEWERLEFLRLPYATQEIVLRRLDVIEGYLAKPSPTTNDAADAAQQLGTSQSNFYRMLARYRAKGAVLGLVPHVRVKRTAKSAGAGYDYHEELKRYFRRHPEAKISLYLQHLQSLASQIEGAQAPSRNTVQRWVSDLRSKTDKAPRSSLARVMEGEPTFGRELLIDQCGLSLEYLEHDPAKQPLATFVIDVETRLLLGAGLGWPTDGGRGLAGALADSGYFWAAPLVGTFRTVQWPEQITWVVPPSSRRSGDHFVEAAANMGIKGIALDAPDREHGARLFELLGETFAYHHLQVFRGAEPPDPATSNRVAQVSLAKTLGDAMVEWNVDLVRRHEGKRLVLKGPTWSKRIARWTRHENWFGLDGSKLGSLIFPSGQLPTEASRYSVRSIWRKFEDLHRASSDG